MPEPIRRTFGDCMDFIITRELASGGMGTVYEALQCGIQGFSKRVALKVLLPELVGDPNLREAFIHEAHLVADLVHENIVQIYHLGQVADADGGAPRLYISMELIDGPPLSRILARHRERGTALAPELAAFIASRLARALEYAHGRTDPSTGRPLGIVHRDICPQNVMVTRGGVVKLSDFGCAKVSERALSLDEEGAILVGRARYMSPEAARLEPTDARSDVYSLGVVLHEMLAGGERPGAARTLLPIGLVNPSCPERLAAIVTRALERAPGARWPTAGEMGLALERFLYDKGYGPTNLSLAAHLRELFPELGQAAAPAAAAP